MEIENSQSKENFSILYVKNPVIEKLRTGDVFFKENDIETTEAKKILERATFVRDGKIQDPNALVFILHHFGWIITNHLNSKQVKARNVKNKLKRKVFSSGLKNIYIVRRMIDADRLQKIS